MPPVTCVSPAGSALSTALGPATVAASCALCVGRCGTNWLLAEASDDASKPLPMATVARWMVLLYWRIMLPGAVTAGKKYWRVDTLL